MYVGRYVCVYVCRRGCAWLPDAEPTGPDVADGVPEPATGGRPTLTGLLGRRVARLEAMLRERPECQVLAFDVSQDMVETLVPRLLDLLAEQNGGRPDTTEGDSARSRFFQTSSLRMAPSCTAVRRGTNLHSC
jgi:hypothetical protein